MAKELQTALPPDTIHLCIDMQRMFADKTPWHTPWMTRALPKVERLVAHRPADTLFTRFIPADKPGDGEGTWKAYWEHWADMTRSRMDPSLIDLVPSLARFAPPATVVDKPTYSPWPDDGFRRALEGLDATTIVVSGAETDVCVLSTILGAVDRGLRTIVAHDAICSSSDEAHDAILTMFNERYGRHVEIGATDQIIAAWSASSQRG